MLCFHGRSGTVGACRVAALPAAFNPPTIAHLAMAQRLSESVDEVLLIVPEQMPHKHFEGASYEQRLQMLAAMAQGDSPP